MKNKRYLLLGLLNIFDLLLILSIVYFLSSSVTSLYIVIGIVLFFFILMIIKTYSKNGLGEVVDLDEETSWLKEYLSVVAQAEKLKGEKIEVKFVKQIRIPNSAFYSNKVVYINVSNPIHKDYFEGMLAHELGHAISGFGDRTILMSLSISTILANMFQAIRYDHLKKRKYKINKVLNGMTYLMILILSYKDIFFLNKYFIEEEFLANDYALQLTDGHSLRTYYYKVHKSRKFVHDRFDMKHPPVKDMLDRMESQMSMSVYEEDVYHIKNKIYYIKETDNREEISIKKHNFYYHVATHDDPKVVATLSNNFLRGNGTKKDIDKAIEYSLLAIELGNDMSLYNLAHIYEGLKEYEVALGYLEQAKEKGLKNMDKAIDRVKKKHNDIQELLLSSTIQKEVDDEKD